MCFNLVRPGCFRCSRLARVMCFLFLFFLLAGLSNEPSYWSALRVWVRNIYKNLWVLDLAKVFVQGIEHWPVH